MCVSRPHDPNNSDLVDHIDFFGPSEGPSPTQSCSWSNLSSGHAKAPVLFAQLRLSPLSALLLPASSLPTLLRMCSCLSLMSIVACVKVVIARFWQKMLGLHALILSAWPLSLPLTCLLSVSLLLVHLLFVVIVFLGLIR